LQQALLLPAKLYRNSTGAGGRNFTARPEIHRENPPRQELPYSPGTRYPNSDACRHRVTTERQSTGSSQNW
jgi:hypothetical protein